MSPKAKKELFNTLLEGEIEIAADTKSEQNWQIVRISLWFKPEVLENLASS